MAAQDLLWQIPSPPPDRTCVVHWASSSEANVVAQTRARPKDLIMETQEVPAVQFFAGSRILTGQWARKAAPQVLKSRHRGDRPRDARRILAAFHRRRGSQSSVACSVGVNPGIQVSELATRPCIRNCNPAGT